MIVVDKNRGKVKAITFCIPEKAIEFFVEKGKKQGVSLYKVLQEILVKQWEIEK